jgi:hypothetical protein
VSRGSRGDGPGLGTWLRQVPPNQCGSRGDPTRESFGTAHERSHAHPVRH